MRFRLQGMMRKIGFWLTRNVQPVTQTCLVLCLSLVTLAIIGLLVPNPSQTVFSESGKPLPVYSVDRSDKKIAISFDAAWGEEKTDEILKILEERNIQTTFFLVGYWVDKYPARVKQIFEAGHEIGNHSNTHPHMSELNEAAIAQELSALSDKVTAITGVRPTLFRPPYGDYDSEVVLTARTNGYEVVQWSVDSLDWKNLGVQPMIDRVVGKVQDGDIILFHNNSHYITEALPTILDALIADGFTIVPVSELLLEGDTLIDNAGVQRNAGSGAEA